MALRDAGLSLVGVRVALMAPLGHELGGLLALRRGGRASFMGGPPEAVPFPLRAVVAQNLCLRGKTMYERADVAALAQLVGSGILRLGPAAGITVAGRFGLDEFERAFECAAANSGPGLLTVIAP